MSTNLVEMGFDFVETVEENHFLFAANHGAGQ